MTEADKDIVVDTPEGIRMFALLSMRGRLHLEMTGIKFRKSTLAALQRQGITKKRTRKGALEDLNNHISTLGGPADKRVCAYTVGSHSDDIVKVFHGEATPVYLCGKHAQGKIDFKKVRK